VTLSPKSSTPASRDSIDFAQLARDIKTWGFELGFQQLGIADTRLDEDEAHLLNWLGNHHHGEMHYMAAHDGKRSRPRALVPGTQRIISVRMDYWPEQADPAENVLEDPARAYVSRYALGRDYHKVLRKRLQTLADRIAEQVGPFGFRAFTDSAPVLERRLRKRPGWAGSASTPT